MLYFVMLILFIVLFVGPIIVRKYITNLPSIPMHLVQPTGQNNNDTTTGITGSALVNFGQDAGTAAAAASGGGAAATAASSSSGSDPFSFGGGGGRFVRW
jgi:1,3-beta-glucan synthase